ncbi:MAG: hypothetical protein ACLPY5_02355 [Candidatus Bathyarchaeia archaeon]
MMRTMNVRVPVYEYPVVTYPYYPWYAYYAYNPWYGYYVYPW